MLLLLVVSCKNEDKKEPQSPKTAQTPIELGREIFEDKAGCATCHLPQQKVVGPSIVEIAKIYKNKNASIAKFLKGNEDPLVDPGQFDVMKANFAITQAMTNQEQQAVEAYMLSFK